MNETVEYLTSNRLIRYPFADDASLDVSDRLEHEVFGCFVDAMVQLKDPLSSIEPRISGIGLTGHTLEFFLDCGDSVRLSCTRSKERFPVVRGETPTCWYTFVLSSDGIRELEGENDLEELFEQSVPLADRCVGRTPVGVTAFEVCGGLKEVDGVRLTQQEALSDSPDFTVSGDATIREGYNMSLSADGQDVTLEAIPGAGAGTAPCPCYPSDEDGFVRGIWSVDGHVRFFNDMCYDFLHDSRMPVGQLRVQAKCKACCTCGMYADIVNNRLIPLRDEILAARKSQNSTLKTYEDAVARWNARLRTATYDDITVTMTGVPLDAAGSRLGGTGVSGRMNRCGIAVNVRNDSFIDVTIAAHDAIINGGSMAEPVTSYMQNGNPVVRNGIGGSLILQPGNSCLFSYFIVKDAYSSSASPSAGFFTKITVEAKDARTGAVICNKTKSISI